MKSYLAYLSLVRQQNIDRLAASIISEDSEADTNGKIHVDLLYITHVLDIWNQTWPFDSWVF